MTKVVLSLDGGGIRGAATTQFLFRVNEALTPGGTSLRECVDFYAGTSTGSIIALGLATTNLTMAQINDLYSYANAKKIFSENKGWFEVDGVNAPRYLAEGKTRVLKENFGDSKLHDVGADKHVLAVTYALEKRQPVVIKTSTADDRDLLSYQVADASSAAPTYFPTRELEIPAGSADDHWLVDGGVVANNPTMCAVSEVRKVWQEPMDDIVVVSVGTGYRTRKVNGPKSQKWGALQWVTKGDILSLLSDERVVSYQAMNILGAGKYIRVNAELRAQPGLEKAPDDAMDDISRTNIKRLKALGDFWFEAYGEAVVQLLTGTYSGPSLDRIDPATGKPIEG